MLRYIGPLTIVPTVSLVGLSMTHVATASCETSWIVSMLLVESPAKTHAFPRANARTHTNTHIGRLTIVPTVSVVGLSMTHWLAAKPYTHLEHTHSHIYQTQTRAHIVYTHTYTHTHAYTRITCRVHVIHNPYRLFVQSNNSDDNICR